MSPVETKNFRLLAAMCDHEQVRRLDAIVARERAKSPHRKVSRSDVVREALDLVLPLLEEQDDALEEAVSTPANIRGP